MHILASSIALDSKDCTSQGIGAQSGRLVASSAWLMEKVMTRLRDSPCCEFSWVITTT